MSKSSLIMMFCFYRSGGTVLNQCLGMLPDVVIMSEVNPLGGGTGVNIDSPVTIQQQAKHWYNIELEHDDYQNSALELAERCQQSGKKLIIRDWCYPDFCLPDAPMSLMGYKELETKADIIPFAFVRNAIDIFLSYSNNNLQTFSHSYLNYVKKISKIGMPIFKYEDFCSNPEVTLRSICAITGLTFSPAYREYSKFTNVNGDVQFQGLSRGSQTREIKPLPRKYATPKLIQELENCPYLEEANNILGYSTRYADAFAHEDITTNKVRGIKNLIFNPLAVTKRLLILLRYHLNCLTDKK